MAVDRDGALPVARFVDDRHRLLGIHTGSSEKTPWETWPSLPLRNMANR